MNPSATTTTYIPNSTIYRPIHELSHRRGFHMTHICSFPLFHLCSCNSQHVRDITVLQNGICFEIISILTQNTLMSHIIIDSGEGKSI